MASPTMEIGSGDVIFKQAVVKGCWGSTVARTMDPAKRAALMGEVVQGIASGALTLPVESVHPLADIAEAMRATAAPGRGGKVLLRP
jgi:NADPH:quinone reductase-like Zn-dependent oxidoreductase